MDIVRKNSLLVFYTKQFVLRFGSILIILVLLSNTNFMARADAPVNVSLSPLHGIHAPIGFRWTDNDRAALGAFHNAAGQVGGPGLVVALSVDMTAANNSYQVRMERDLYNYQAQGSKILVRMYPQRFPGGRSDVPNPAFNSVSGTPEDAADDILRFLSEQEAREGWHFTNIIPGNEMNIEWPNQHYDQNLLPWLSNDDPHKYEAINQFMLDINVAWQQRLTQPEGRRFQDVQLFFPALSQDGAPDHFGGFYFYDNGKPSGNKYDLLREAIEAMGHFSWHNYWRPGQAWSDRAIVNFPAWLKHDLAQNFPAYITESGWSPQAMTIEQSNATLNLWRKLPFQLWFVADGRRNPFTYTQDDILGGHKFEDDLQYFIEQCSGAANNQAQTAQGVAVWLAGSNGGFPEAAGVWRNQQPSRWLHSYALWNR